MNTLIYHLPAIPKPYDDRLIGEFSMYIIINLRRDEQMESDCGEALRIGN